MKMTEILNVKTFEHAPIDMSPWTLPGAEITLNEAQGCALSAVVSAQGGFFPVGVGHGKTFIALLAGVVLNRHSVVFCPPHTLSQMHEELERLRHSFRFDKTVEIIPYSQISMPNGRDRVIARLQHLDPKDLCVVLDEAHAIKNPKSARARRILSLCSLLQCPVIALSGTMTNRSLDEFEHIVKMTLASSFIPTTPQCRHPLNLALKEPRHYSMLNPGVYGTFLDGMGRTADEVKSRFRDVMRGWNGVHITSATSVGASIRLSELHYDVPPALQAALNEAKDFVNPLGEEIFEPSERWLLQRTLSSGWWYELIWDESLPPEFFVARRRFWGIVRSLVDNGTYESPSNCIRAMQEAHKYGAKGWLAHAWAQWLPWKDHPPPDRKSHIIDRSVIASVVQRARTGEPPIIWYHYAKTADLLEEHGGIKVWRAGESPVKTPHLCAMSIPSHGEGLNLQQWRRAIVLEPPSTGKAWEQLLGRLHRVGTPHDEVWFEVAQATESQVGAYHSALGDARFVESVMGQRQKLLLSRLV